MGEQPLRVFFDLVLLRSVIFDDRHEYLPEARPSVPILGREIGAPEERLPVGSQENAQRPAAAGPHRCDRLLVSSVDIGPLVSVELDADEILVEEADDLVVLEAFLRHHVTPVAPYGARAQEDGFIFLSCLLEGFVGPGIPVDLLMGRVLQVGRFFFRESVQSLFTLRGEDKITTETQRH